MMQLEDKVAELEAQNQATQSENENLRDLLQRLQTENQSLKQTAFTFSVPHGVGVNAAAGPGPTTQSNMAQAGSSMNLFSSTPLVQQPPAQQQPANNDDIDWNSLTAFDPSVLSMLDEPADGSQSQAMNVDYTSPASSVEDDGKSPYRTIVSNPMFMSFADPNPMYDQFWSSQAILGNSSSAGSSPNEPRHSPNGGAAQQQQQQASWTPPAPSSTGWSPPLSLSSDPNALDDIFGSGNFMSASSPVDFSSFMSSPGSSISPVSHHNIVRHGSGSSSTTSAGSPNAVVHSDKECPKTKEELARAAAESGASPFAEQVPAPTITKSTAGPRRPGEKTDEDAHIFCAGSNFPKVAQSADNIEVLAAWRSITSNPKFKVSFCLSKAN
jgi:AP-1-like transcription factor